MLKLNNIVAGYGSITALKDLSITVEEGQIVSLIGANGAGKTTLMKTITGVMKVSSGTIEFLGEDITDLPAHKIVEKGISLVPEGRQVLASMSVIDNLRLGAYQRKDDEINSDIEKMYEMFPILEERKDQLAGTMSGGQQQMLAMARALMARPKLLLLDEPSMGLAPLVVQEIFDIIEAINKQGTTVLLVEQNANKALGIADYAYVLETGKLIMDGPASEIAGDPKVKAAYLGG